MASSPPQPQIPPQQRRKPKMAETDRNEDGTDSARSASAFAPVSSPSPSSSSSTRNLPYLPTRHEVLVLAIFPTVLLFGALFSALSPETRAAEMTTVSSTSTAHYAQSPNEAPSYFARKDNVFNVLFVKRGWLWISTAFALFVATHPSFGVPAISSSLSSSSSSSPSSKQRHAILSRRASAVLRWGLVTVWWILVTQWCFGPALIDRSFRLTGGGCEAVQEWADSGGSDSAAGSSSSSSSSRSKQLVGTATAAACKSAGGRWRGGHDISGHVFLLVLGSSFLLQEVGWVVWRQVRRARAPAPRGAMGGSSTAAGAPVASRKSNNSETRTIVMPDGAVKTAEVEAGGVLPDAGGMVHNEPPFAGLAVRFAAAVVGLSLWMLLMTAIYFHTWFEKLTGLLVALAGFYGVYILPRWVPAVRRVVGLPGL